MGAPGQPTRTCVGCRREAGRGDLLRLVRSSADAVVRVDAAGSAAGRGAYVHRERSCVEAALARGALGKALRTGLGPEEAARLRLDIERELRV
jgi:predicted RNA-binding protein YlxR (DUF448 family)